jgi:N-acyl-D-aspartate/D-glutamate deacylase
MTIAGPEPGDSMPRLDPRSPDLLTDLRSPDLLMVGGTVVDGTGRPGRRADVAISGDRIAAVGSIARSAAKRVLDVSNMAIAPGFIDAHGHSDIAVLSSPHLPSKVHQGITTEVMGNCGLAVAPLGAHTDADAVRSLLSIVDVDPGVAWRWRSMAEYLSTVESQSAAINVAVLAGHLAIRASCVGFDDRAATPTEIGDMQSMVDRALADGAVGLSSGLMYPPNAYARAAELTALGHVVARHGALFAFHMRNYGDRLLESVAEVLAVAEQSGCRVQISHLAVAGQRNWGKVARALDEIGAASRRGIDVGLDIYPYLAGSTNLTQLLPRWTLEGGTGKLLERLAEPTTRSRISADIEHNRLHDWHDILLAGGVFPGRADPVGRSVADLAALYDLPPVEVLLDLATASRGTAVIVAFGRSEDDLRAALMHPLSMIGSDGLGLDPAGPSGAGQPHPRSYGCYPRLLGSYVRDEHVLTLEAAVHKSTFQVAQRFAIPDRGVVAPGYVADLVVFDPAVIADHSTYTDPHQMATGISAVIVSGQAVLWDGQPTGRLPGVVFRRDHG